MTSSKKADPNAKAIIVASDLPKDHPVLATILKMVSGAHSVDHVTAVEIGEVSALEGQATVLIPVLAPDVAIAEQILAERAPADVMTAWCEGNGAVMKLARKLRRRAVLVDALSVLGKDKPTLALLKERCGLDLSKGRARRAPKWSVPGDQTTTLAALMVEASSEARGISEWMHDALPGDREEIVGDKAALYERILVADGAPEANDDFAAEAEEALKSAEAEFAAEQTELLEEIDLLRDSLSHALSELRNLEGERDELHATLRDKENELSDAYLTRVLNESLEKRLAESEHLSRRREAILGRAFLDAGSSSGAQAVEAPQPVDSQELDRAWGEVAELRTRIDRIFSSKAWRLVASKHGQQDALVSITDT